MNLYLAVSTAGTGSPRHLQEILAAQTPEGMPVLPELALLCSFHYFRRTSLAGVRARFPGVALKLFADSGGFSASTLGETVRLADYARWLRANKRELTQYANLDVIGDPETTARNQRVLESEGLEPIPVFHVGSDFRHLAEILERSNRVCLGGMVPHIKAERGKLAAWIAACFARMKPSTRVHGFGLGTSWKLCRSFPWDSLDSSSWTSAFQYRQVDVFDEGRGQFTSVSLSTAGGKAVWKHADLLRTYGFSPGDFYPPSRFSYLKAGALTVASVLRAQRWLRERAA